MRRLEPGEGRESPGDCVGLGAALEDIRALDLAGEVGPNFGAQLEVLADVDAHHHRDLALAGGGASANHRDGRIVAGQVFAASREVDVVADHVAAHDRGTNLVVGRDVIERLDVVDVQVEAEV